MIVIPSEPIVTYDPGFGWTYRGEPISERSAQYRCKTMGIPYHKPAATDPFRWYSVLHTRIAGTCFIDGAEELISGLSRGSELQMGREYNPHDSMAIALYLGYKKIGYIPRKDNTVIARLMDAGEKFRCIVSSNVDYDNVSIDVLIRRERKVRRHFSKSSDCMSGDCIVIDVDPVTRDTTEFHPVTENVRNLIFRFPLSEDVIWDLRWGHLSHSMDDRWNFFMEGDTMYISRSWTGDCIFEVTLGRNGGHSAVVENDQNICNVSDDRAMEILNDLFNHWTSPISVPESAVPEDIFGNIQTHEGPGYYEFDPSTGIIHVIAGVRDGS